MVTLKAHILPHPDLQPPGCRGSGKRLFDKALPNDASADMCHLNLQF
ncbi:hypothetical protein [Shigella sonnei]|nr:hypothetical protein [Shigella sonnei]